MSREAIYHESVSIYLKKILLACPEGHNGQILFIDRLFVIIHASLVFFVPCFSYNDRKEWP